MDRREALKTFSHALVGAAVAQRNLLRAAAPPGTLFDGLREALAAVERGAKPGRLGVAVLDTVTGAQTGYRVHERFTMCSTFKFLLAASVLQRVDRGAETLERSVAIPPAPLVAHSPLTEPHAGGTMKVSDLCFAMLTQSDNTAANVLLAGVGGPGAYTSFARSLGDRITRLDRTEPTLNEIRPGDERDTTSPAATLADMRSVLLEGVLAARSREQLIAWMAANHTGDERLRKGLPPGWRAGDKTGSNGIDTNNDIAVLWPPHRGPVLVTAYFTGCPGPDAKRNAVLAKVGELVRRSIATNSR